ncbi:MAG TPA: hypothetical protein VF720_16855 [Candidatus Eisenbacteria bacterium]
MKLKLTALVAFGVLAMAPAAMAQGNSSDWTDLGSPRMKGRLGVAEVSFDTLMVHEVQFAYDDASNFRIGQVTIMHGPRHKPWPQDFLAIDPLPGSPRIMRLRKPVRATEIRFLYSNLIPGEKSDVHVLVR